MSKVATVRAWAERRPEEAASFSVTGDPSAAFNKVRENRLRRMAARQGYMLVKSRRRDPRAQDYGLYVLVGDSKGNRLGRHGGQAAVSAFAKGEGMTLDRIEHELS
jgi:hypothetical protein